MRKERCIYRSMTPAEFCDATNAWKEVRVFALTQPTMADVWDHCPRVDWLLWIVDQLGQKPDDRTLRLFAVWCARNTRTADGRKTGDLLTDSRLIIALDVAQRFVNKQATSKELAAAWNAAWDVAWDAAWDATWYAADDDAVTTAWAAANDAQAAQAAHFRTLMPNPFRKEAQP